MYILCRNCSSSYTEHNKIGFAIFGFFYDFIWVLQFSGTTQKRRKNLLSQESLEVFNFTTLPSALTHRPSNSNSSHRGALGGGGRLAGGDVGLGMGIKRYPAAIRCTRA
jgi:hypothetical protein